MDVEVWPLVDVCHLLPKAATHKWPLGTFDEEVWSLDGSSLSIFVPTPTDFQTAHEKNEIYCIARGRATLSLEGREVLVQAGAAIFVAAGTRHRFVAMSEGFAAWVIFLPRTSQDEI